MEKSDAIKNLETEIILTQQEIKRLQVLMRVNNMIMSRFILQLQTIRQYLDIPKRETFFKFELLESDYQELVSEFGKDKTDKALFHLDRLLLKNKQKCPNNIKKYIRNRLIKKKKNE